MAQCILDWADAEKYPPMTPEPAPTIRQLLAFYLEAGVDCALSEEPVDRLSESERPEAVKTTSAATETIAARTLRPAPASR